MSFKEAGIKSIHYTYPVYSTFVDRDLAIIRKKFRVALFFFGGRPVLLSFLLQLFSCLGAAFRGRSFMVQFAGIHALVPVVVARLTGCKSVIFLGGTDCVSFPAISYGNFASPANAWFTRLSVKWCTYVIATNETILHSEYTYLPAMKGPQGIQRFVPSVTKKSVVIKFDFDPNFWKNVSGRKEENSFITIATDFGSESRFILKGIDLFVMLAHRFPAFKFTIVGGESTRVFPPNVRLRPFISHEEIRKELSTHRHYIQLSVSEGFSNTLCESMLCECVPVVSNVFFMPFLVGDAGFILEVKDESRLLSIIEDLKNHDLEALGLRARQRICTLLPAGTREKELLQFLETRIP